MDILHGDCLSVMPTLGADSIDACVTDPPYGLSFMGKNWDHGVPGVAFWREVFRVLKPGAHLVAFGGTRTFHRLVCAIEDAGFEIRDQGAWLYGSGFPKSLDVSKAIDKAAGAEREVVGRRSYGDGHVQNSTQLKPPIGTFARTQDDRLKTVPATPAAQQWSGWGTALKPAHEPLCFARKPLIGTVAENVLRYGTGALNVDGCRVGTESTIRQSGCNAGVYGTDNRANIRGSDAGRWPANVMHDGSPEVLAVFPETGPTPGTYETTHRDTEGYSGGWAPRSVRIGHKDAGGSAARFFYSPKASKRDRDEGLEAFEARAKRILNGGITSADHPEIASGGGDRMARNVHPTVKPTDLMRWLCRLVTPPGGVVLDPFTGSGSTGKAAVLEGFRFIGIEREAEYVEIARARIAAAQAGAPLLTAAE